MQCREQLVLQLSQLLEARESHISNLEASSVVHKSLSDLLQLSANEHDNGPESLPIFDHSHCHDCSYVQSISSDCVSHLQSLTKQTVEASQRLLQLVELRERVRDSAEFLTVDYDTLPEGATATPPSTPVAAGKQTAESADK